MAENLDIYVRIAADAARYAQGLTGAQRQTKTFVDQTRLQFQTLRNEMARLGLQIGTVGIGLHGIKVASGMQDEMLKVEANIKKTTTSAGDLAKQLREVRDTASSVSKDMPYSAKEIVQISNSLLKAGVPMEQVKGKKGAAYSAAGLAMLSETDPKQVGDMLARIGSQFNFKPEDYAKNANVLMQAEAASPGNLQEIMYSMRQFGANANLVKMSFKDAALASAALTPLGGEAGTAMNRFLEDSAGKTKHQRKALEKLGLVTTGKDGKKHSALYDDKGQFVGMEKTAELLKNTLGKLAEKNPAKAMVLATKAWGEEGARAAMQFAMATGEKNIANLKKEMEEATGIEERMAIRMKGFEMATKAAAGTVQTTLGMAFDPMLNKLGEAATLVNDIAAEIGEFIKFTRDDKEKGGLGLTDNQILAGGAGIVGGALAGGAAWRKFRGKKGAGIPGAGILGDAAELGKGVAVGKALQAAAGVTPVFVVNMPSGCLPGAPSSSPSIPPVLPGSAKGASVLNQAKTMYALAAGMPLSAWGSMGLAGIGTAAAGVTAAGAVGYGAGTLISKSLEGTKAGDWMVDNIGGGIAKVWALFGHEESARAVEINEKLKNTNLSGELKIKVLRSDDGTEVEAEFAPRSGSALKSQVGYYMDGAS